MFVSIYWAPKKACTTKKYIEREVTTYYINQYWVIYLELYVKYSLR